jgi:hypothetical protein
MKAQAIKRYFVMLSIFMIQLKWCNLQRIKGECILPIDLEEELS